MNPTVSVIIPVYNGARLVGEAIDSVLRQTLPGVELIVVDDGSTDDTPDVLASFGARIRTLRLPQGGVSRARNAGMAASQGELLAFLDADDVWHRNKLARQVAALRRWPQAGLCCCDYRVEHRARGQQVRHFKDALPLAGLAPAQALVSAPLPALLRCNFVGTASTVLLRRALATRVGQFDPRLRQAEDYDYWLRCARLMPFLLLATPLLDKRSHADNLTNNALETQQCHEQVLLALAANGAVPADSRALLADALSQIRYRIARQLALRGAAHAALRYCLQGWHSHQSLGNLGRAMRTAAHCLMLLRSARS